MENALEIKGLCKSYGEFSLKDVSFSLPKGYIMGFVGQNGAGKTTTIRSMMNMAHPDSGEIKIFGLDSIQDSCAIKQDIGVVFDDLYFTPHLTPKQIAAQLKCFYRHWSDEKFFGLLDKFKLPAKKKCGQFSRGMKMKLMLSAALAHDAQLLILDEPTSGLDPVARDELLDILTEYIGDENKSILFSTHITADLERIADYITILHDGKIFYCDTKDRLMEKYIVIKGGVEELPKEIEERSIGYHAYRNGFEAMLERSYESELPDGIIAESADIDEILVYIAKEAAKNEKS